MTVEKITLCCITYWLQGQEVVVGIRVAACYRVQLSFYPCNVYKEKETWSIRLAVFVREQSSTEVLGNNKGVNKLSSFRCCDRARVTAVKLQIIPIRANLNWHLRGNHNGECCITFPLDEKHARLGHSLSSRMSRATVTNTTTLLTVQLQASWLRVDTKVSINSLIIMRMPALV